LQSGHERHENHGKFIYKIVYANAINTILIRGFVLLYSFSSFLNVLQIAIQASYTMDIMKHILKFILVALIFLSGTKCIALDALKTPVYASRSLKGEARTEMQDVFHNYSNEKGLFFSVFDGHGGLSAATFAKDHLYKNFCRSEFFPQDIEEAFKQAFIKTDADYKDSAGTTAVCVWCDYTDKLWIANVGDSRAVLFRNGAVLALTKDHNPKDPVEMARIKQLEGTVIPLYSSQPWPLLTGYSLDNQNVPVRVVEHVQHEVQYITTAVMSLAVSRALGDHELSNLVNHEPDVTSYVLDGTEGFLVLGSDGLFDVMTNEAVVQFIQAHMKTHGVTLKTVTSQVAQAIVNDLGQEALDIFDHDNVTVTVIFFK